MKLITRNVCKFAPTIMVGMLLLPASSHAATLVSHWTMNNPSPYANSVSGGPAMIADGATRAPATFDADETRLELDFGSSRSTRLSAVSTTLNLNTFSFSMIIDPTDMANFTTLIQKESGASNAFADYQRVGWQVLHTEFGNIEFVIRGTDPGSKDFYGSLVVTGASSGMSAGANFDSDIHYQIAGGYDSTNGATYFYVTALGGTLTGLNGGTSSKDAGAVQDASALSAGSARSGADFVSYGAGFDLADLQIYNDLLSESDLLFLANNPGQSVPEPAAVLIGCLGLLSFLRRRRM
jgi:hypothetical protein